MNAGIPLQVCANAPMTLYGQASGLFLGSGNITWTQVAGPAVSIVSPNSLTTSVTGYASGNHYTFKLSAMCSDNSLVWDTVTYYVKSITFANAGTNQQVCGGAGALSANPPSTGETGHWQFTGPGNGITITSPSSPASQIMVDPAYSGTTTLLWTITNANGCLSADDVTITNLGGISPVDAGPDQVLGNCYTVNTWTTLAASFGGAGSGQTGTWALVSGPNMPFFGNIHQDNTNIHGLVAGTYILRWTVAGPCVNGTDLVSITVPPAGQVVTEAMTPNQSFCDGRTTFILSGNNPLYNGETVLWTKVSGADPVLIADPASPVTAVTVPAGTGTYVFCYTITNPASGCYSFANATVTFNSNPSLTISSGNNMILNCNDTTAIITYSQTGSGSVMWSIVSGPPTPYYPVLPTPYYNAGISPVAITHLSSPGTYVIRFRKSPGSGSGCATVFTDITVTTSRAPSPSNAGTPQVLACNVASTHLAGNNPLTGSGTWSQVSGPGNAVIANPHLATTLISGLVSGQYFFRWTISGGPTCGNSQSEVSVAVSSTTPGQSNAGPDQSVCFGTPVMLHGNQPSPNETGTWTVMPPAGVVFSNIHAPHATVNGLASSTAYQFTWTIANACGSSSDVAVITTGNTAGSVQANAGPDQCQPSGTSTVILSGNNPAPGTGLWTNVSGGPATILDPAQYNTTVTGMTNGNYRFEWRISNGSCEPSRDTVLITISPPATPANAGPDQEICGTSVILNGNTPAIGTGSWSQVAGNAGALIADTNAPLTTATGLTSGTYVFRWTIRNYACPGSFSDVTVRVSTPPAQPQAGADQELCGQSSTVMAANPITGGTAYWSVVAGPNTPVFANPVSPTTAVSGLISGTYLLRWTSISGPYCPPATDDVSITVNPAASAGSDQYFCEAEFATLTGNPGSTGIWSQVWGPDTAIITPTGNNTAIASGLVPGVYFFQYAISAPGCATSTDVMAMIISGQPTTADAGPDQELCEAVAFTLSGNVPVTGTGTWTKIAGPAGGTFIPDCHAVNAQFTGAVTGTYIFAWTIAEGTCSNADQVRITSTAAPTTSNAGPDQTLCDADTVSLNGNVPVIGMGTWTQVSGPGASDILDPLSPSTIVTGIAAGTYIFQWTITNGPCSSSSLVIIAIDLPPTAANAGPPQTHCGPVLPATSITITMAGNVPAVGSGSWSVVTGPNLPTITAPASPTTTVTGVVYGTYVFSWTITNGTCVPSFSEVTVTVQSCVPVTFNEYIQVCAGSSATGNVLENGDYSPQGGSLSVSGIPILSPQHGLFDITATGDYTYSPATGYSGPDLAVVSVCDSSGNCAPDSLFITALPADGADAGPDQLLCLTEATASTFLDANTPVTGTGFWQQVAGPTQSTIVNPLDPGTAVMDLVAGNYGFMWTIANGPCPSARDDMTVKVSPAPSASAGPDLYSCSASPVAIEGSSASGFTSIYWTTTGSGSFDDPHALHPRYIPGTGDIQDGGVVLTITAMAGVPCPPASDEVVLTISVPVVVKAGRDESICDGHPVVLREASVSGNIPVTWTTTGTGRFSDPYAVNPVYTPGEEDLEKGSVVLTITADSATECGSDPDDMTLFLSKSPLAEAGPDGAVCPGMPYEVTDAFANNYNKIQWSHNGAGSLSGAGTLTPVYTPATGESGTIILTLTVIGIGDCSSSSAIDDMLITIHSAPEADAGPGMQIPYNGSVTLSGTAGGGSGTYYWDWQPAPLLLGNNVPDPVTVNLTNDITYRLTVTDLETGCRGTDSLFIAVGLKRVPPVAVNDYDTAELNIPLRIFIMNNDKAGDMPVVTSGICNGPRHGTAVSNDDLTITYHADPEFAGIDSMRYYICDSGDPSLCDTASVFIYIGRDPLGNILVFYNVITPNGDGVNDEWVIGGIEEFPENLVEIYNRWGDLVNSFERYDNTARIWKGTNFRNEPLPDGTYYYLVSIKNFGTRTGWIFTRGGFP